MGWIASGVEQLWPILMQLTWIGLRRTMRTLHLTDWGRVLLEKLIVIRMVQKFPIFSRTKICCYITVLHPYPMAQEPPAFQGLLVVEAS